MAARLTTYLVVAIVAATLIAGLIVGAQRDDNDGPVDLIVNNAEVYTADGDGTRADAVAIRGNQILRVGSEREIMRLRRPQTMVIDAGGATVLPGFNDAHAHVIAGGLSLDKISLHEALTLEQMTQRIRAWADTSPESAWVLGRGWQSDRFFGGQPTRQQLDAIVPDRPAQLLSHDGQSSWVNSAALKRAGITGRTPNPPNGVIVRDSKTGEPTGVLKAGAISLVSRRIPAPTSEERARALRAAVAEAHLNGITSFQNASGDAEDFSLFAEAHRAGDLDVRIYSALGIEKEFTDAERVRLLDAARRHPDDPIFKSGVVKITLDGSIEAHTASMLEAYEDDGAAGVPNIARDELNRIVRLIDAEGWQVMTHASGDRAVRLALDAFAHAARSNPAPDRGRRHRIEHAEFVDPLDVPRFDLLGVLASMQPFNGSPSRERLETWSRRLGSERALRALPYRSILAAGGRLAFGSNWPAAALNPLLGIHAAVTRTTPEGLPEDGWNRSQRLAIEAAIDAYTSSGAWASFDEQRKGSIAPGMLADLVVLSEDIFDAPRSTLPQTHVALTIFDGKVVYRRDRGTN
jgi:predicted amidohydrolase YtcJ